MRDTLVKKELSDALRRWSAQRGFCLGGCKQLEDQVIVQMVVVEDAENERNPWYQYALEASHVW